jgi:hypothetical protein
VGAVPSLRNSATNYYEVEGLADEVNRLTDPNCRSRSSWTPTFSHLFSECGASTERIRIKVRPRTQIPGYVALNRMRRRRSLLRERRRRLVLSFRYYVAVGFIAFPALQAWLNLHYLGSIFSNGYAFWLPAFYSSAVFKTFKLSYLVARADPIYRHGNLVAYSLAMLGIDGIFGQLHLGTESRTLVHARYSLFPFPVVVFAAIGVFCAMRDKRNAATMRATYSGFSFLALLLLIYLPYFHVEPRFMLPALFIVFAAAAGALSVQIEGLNGDGRDLR